MKAKELGIQRGNPSRGAYIAKSERFIIEILPPESSNAESRIS